MMAPVAKAGRFSISFIEVMCSMSKPILYVFLISHYCEKARWALDYCGVDYKLKVLSPIEYRKKAESIGAKSSALPILQLEDEVIQGSAEIIAWSNAKALEEGRQGLILNEESIAIEKRLDDVLGVHVRRWFYSEALLDCPEIVLPVFSKGSGFIKRLLIKAAWPTVVRFMIKGMDLGPTQEQESKEIVLKELDWLDSLLSDSTDYLCGNSLSNADIAAASLMAPMISPPTHPASDVMSLPPRVAATAIELSERPFAKWVSALYLNRNAN